MKTRRTRVCLRMSLALLGVFGVGLTRVGAVESVAHWPQFRGPNGQGISVTARPPVEFGPRTHLAWKVPVASGHSSPVIWDQAIFLTTWKTGELAVVSLDRRDGGVSWEWRVPAGPVQDVHSASSPAAPTAAVDADRVYAYFGSWGLAALWRDGREAWRRPMAPPRNRYGMATSPVVHGGRVFLVLDADDLRSRIVAFEAATGEVAWEADRTGQRATWSTPAIWSPRAAGLERAEQLVVLSAMRLAAYDVRNGSEVWSVEGFPQETVSVPAIGDRLVYAGAAALGGRGNETYDAMGWQQLAGFDQNADGLVQAVEIPDAFRMVLRPDVPTNHPGYAIPFPFKRDFKGRDLNQDGALSEEEWRQSVARWEASSRPVLMAIRPDPGPGEADSGTRDERVVWRASRGLPEMPSLLLDRARDRLYFVRDGGLLSCLDATDGRLIYQERLGAAGQYCASPVLAAGHLYLTSVAGVITVVDIGTDAFRVIARNDLGDSVHATPALAGDSIYVRTAGHLLAFTRPAP